MPSSHRHKSASHQLHVCVSQQVKHVCVLRTSSTLAQWHNFHILTPQYLSALLNRYFITVFQIIA